MPTTLTRRKSRSRSLQSRSCNVIIPIPTIRFSGHFTVDLICARTGIIKRHLEFRNLIVDSGLNAIGNGTITTNFNSMFQYIGVGTDNTAPANAQTGLLAELARTGGNGGIAPAATTGADYRGVRYTYEFLEAEANGNLTELGIFHGNSLINTGTMWCRQLFKDVGGTATILSKTSAERLRIAYEVRMHFATADVTGGSVTVNAVAYPFTIRAIDVNGAWTYPASFNLWTTSPGLGRWDNTQSVIESNVLVAQTANISGQTNNTSVSASAYVAGTFTRDEIAVFNTSIANFGTGIGSFLPSLGSRVFQVAFITTKLPKNNTQQLTVTARFTWARYP